MPDIVVPRSSPSRRTRIGVAVTFAALSQVEHLAVEQSLRSACSLAKNWELAFSQFTTKPIDSSTSKADLLVYLGESSRFESVAGQIAERIPVVFVKSTVEELLVRPAGRPMRYRMSTGVFGIAQALAGSAALVPTVDWTSLPWPPALAQYLHLDPGEQSYVTISIDTFRQAAAQRGIEWQHGLPTNGQPFSIFLTMHDPSASFLSDYALRTWPHCTVIAADGMTSTAAPDGSAWPDRLIHVRHWTALSRSHSNSLYRSTLGAALPDIDSPGMLFGTLHLLDTLLGAGAQPGSLEKGGRKPGPLGLMRMTTSGHPDPERVIIFCGRKWSIFTIHP